MNAQKHGGLPDYICQIARAIKRSGKSTSQAVAIAVSRVKKWAAGGDDVDADTRAKAARALAQWEKKKASAKSDNVKASRADGDFLCLAAKSFNVDMVRRAFDAHSTQQRKTWRESNSTAAFSEGPSYEFVREMWTDHLIVEADRYSGTGAAKLYKYAYTVDGDNVSFGDPVEVKTQYVTVKAGDMAGAELSDRQILDMAAKLGPCGKGATDALLQLSARPVGALEQVLAAAKRS